MRRMRSGCNLSSPVNKRSRIVFAYFRCIFRKPAHLRAYSDVRFCEAYNLCHVLWFYARTNALLPGHSGVILFLLVFDCLMQILRWNRFAGSKTTYDIRGKLPTWVSESILEVEIRPCTRRNWRCRTPERIRVGFRTARKSRNVASSWKFSVSENYCNFYPRYRYRSDDLWNS